MQYFSFPNNLQEEELQKSLEYRQFQSELGRRLKIICSLILENVLRELFTLYEEPNIIQDIMDQLKDYH